MDTLRFILARIPDEHFLALAELCVNELIKGDSTVREVGFGQTAPLLEALQIRGGLRDQGNGDSLG